MGLLPYKSFPAEDISEGYKVLQASYWNPRQVDETLLSVLFKEIERQAICDNSSAGLLFPTPSLTHSTTGSWVSFKSENSNASKTSTRHLLV